MRNVPKFNDYSFHRNPPNSCATNRNQDGSYSMSSDYSFRQPQSIEPANARFLSTRVCMQWGAYDANGQLIRSGLASAGRDVVQ